jgi:hypothetical protein
MSECHGCGGVIGRDCFNPQECEQITRQMAEEYQRAYNTPPKAVNPHADEFDEAEYRLRQDVEEAIEQAADCLHDATSWWAKEEKGPRTIDTLIGMIVVAAKEYRRTLEVQRIPQFGEHK